MKIFLLFTTTTLLLTLFSESPTLGAEGAPVFFKGTNIGPVVDHFSHFVDELNKPITIYNWSPRPDGEFWRRDRPQDDPKYIRTVKKMSEVFWRSFGSQGGRGNSNGFGLYGAADPIASVGFGHEDWLLLEMKLPRGFRMINFLGPQRSWLGSGSPFWRVMENFKCPTLATEFYFNGGGASLPRPCVGLIKQVFQKELKIDGFAYGYTHTHFKACENAAQSEAAFVIASARWIDSQTVKFFSQDTKIYTADRIRIQSLFLKNKQADNYGLENPLEERLIHAVEAEKFEPGKLLWDDLEGKPKSATIDRWLKENKYWCDGKNPFISNEAQN